MILEQLQEKLDVLDSLGILYAPCECFYFNNPENPEYDPWLKVTWEGGTPPLSGNAEFALNVSGVAIAESIVGYLPILPADRATAVAIMLL